MDSNSSGPTEKNSVRGGLSNGPSFRRPPGARPMSGSDGTSPHSNHLPFQQVTITVYKDEKGYGMKVSGDNPVYVQSVKEGGAAERAGLHSGDKIIKVNGVNVTHSTHTEVVELIKSASQVVLTVQQRCSSQVARSPTGTIASPAMARSPLQHHHSAPSRDRITGPQPVDGEKKRQVEYERVHTLQLMLEKEQRFVECLRSELAKTNDIKKQEQLAGAERRVQTLQQQLLNLSSHYEQEPVSPNPRHVDLDIPPPLPSRNPPLPPTTQSPPPLPPRQYLLAHSESVPGPVNSNAPSPGGQIPTHHRTKSNPDTLSAHNLSLAEASKRLIASESMSELHFAKRSKGGVAWDVDSPRVTPPGTPPPPYGGAAAGSSTPATEDISPAMDENDTTRGEPPPGEIPPNPGLSPQPPIISMEEDEMSDQEMSQLEDHGPFKSLSRLWNSHAHLAVFMNYVISNSEPSSLLFYLLTDLYRAGNAKEMKKWAYEIHSSFLVPGAPLRLANVDENIAREVDDGLQNESDKEEILRKVFWKARNRAKEDLNEQLADFQQKRTAGLGTLFGPPDSTLDESIHDKSKELKIVESILLPKLEPFLEEIDKDVVDDRRFTTGAALGTVLGKVFGVRSQAFSSMLDRCPTFVSKDKSLKAKLLTGKTRKVTARGHHFVAHHYYTVTYCNHCQLIIWGIGPQGYQCSDCGLNIHRACVKVLEESCPGPMVKKEKGNDRISKLMERIMPDPRRKPSSLNLTHAERVRRQQEEAENTDTESGERAVSGSRADRRPDPVSEERGSATPHHHPHPADHDDDSAHHEQSHHVTKSKPSATSINRSESYKERIHQKRQLRERRKTSDPNLSKSNNDVDLEAQALSYHSGSSSNSSLSTRSLDSPSNSLEAVSGGRGAGGDVTPHNGGGGAGPTPPWDSDTEADVVDPPDWKNTVPEDILMTLTPHEIKRQEVINELFMTERSHVRGLKVLDRVFYRPMKEQQVLPQEQIQLLFSNLEEMLVIHSNFNNSMKAKRKEGPVIGEIGDLLYSMFEGPDGEHFQEAAANFCKRQQIALEALKERRRKDPKLNTFLSDAEGNPVCRRLQLKDIIPSGMFRLTKYPLLLKNLEKYTSAGTEEATRVARAEQRSREILNYVNTAVKEAEDEHRLAEIQRRLDKGPFDKVDNVITNEFRNLDLTRHRLIHEGPLNWRIANRPKLIDLHVLLLEDVIILLQKQDDKYVLKYYSSTLSPIIKVSTVIVRPNAVDKKALFLVNTAQNGAQIYDLVATSSSEKRLWFKHISDAAEAYKTREGKHRRQDTSAHEDNHDKTKESEDSGASNSELLSTPRTEESQSEAASPTLLPSSETTPQASPSPQHPDTPEPPSRKSGEGLSPSPVRRVAEPLRQTTAESCLIEPTEVVICQSPVLTAEPVLTPLEKLRRTDERIRESLEEKRHLVAEILHVPPADYDTISELAAEPSQDKEPHEILLALSNQANKLTSIINEHLHVTEEEAVTASRTSEERQRCPFPSVPAHVLQQISSQFNAQLTLLMSVMKTREEERLMFRHENQRSREQLHAVYERQQPTTAINTSMDNQRPTDLEPVDVGAACLQSSSMSQEDGEQTSDKIPTTPEVFVDALSGEVETEESVPEVTAAAVAAVAQ